MGEESSDATGGDSWDATDNGYEGGSHPMPRALEDEGGSRAGDAGTGVLFKTQHRLAPIGYVQSAEAQVIYRRRLAEPRSLNPCNLNQTTWTKAYAFRITLTQESLALPVGHGVPDCLVSYHRDQYAVIAARQLREMSGHSVEGQV